MKSRGWFNEFLRRLAFFAIAWTMAALWLNYVYPESGIPDWILRFFLAD